MTDQRQEGPARPEDPNHVKSTLEEIAIEPFLNASNYLKANDLHPLPNVQTGLQVWEVEAPRGGGKKGASR